MVEDKAKRALRARAVDSFMAIDDKVVDVNQLGSEDQ